MKITSLFTGAAIFLLSLASGMFAAALYTLTVAGCFALIVTADYGSRSYRYAAGRRDSASHERLPLAA